MEQKRVALVTGAGRGIGRGIVLELAGSGFDLAGVSRTLDPSDRQKGLSEVKEKAEAAGAVFLPVQGDIASLGDHERIVAEVLGRFGRIDLLVNNAGVAPLKRTDLLETAPESFDRVLGINLRGTFFLSQRVAREMIAGRENGSAGKTENHIHHLGFGLPFLHREARILHIQGGPQSYGPDFRRSAHQSGDLRV